jgi:very-short-patch-repair endonuclease
MKPFEIKKVAETKDTNEVNRLLNNGWRIIRIFPSQTVSQDGTYHTAALYVLGSKETSID